MAGILLRYAFFGDRRRLLHHYLWSVLLLTLFFMLFPILSLCGLLTKDNIHVPLVILRALVGLSSFAITVTMVSLLHAYF